MASSSTPPQPPASLQRQATFVAGSGNGGGGTSSGVIGMGMAAGQQQLESATTADTAGSGAQVEGHEFFRRVRGTLPPDRFRLFLNAIKELNEHRKSKADVLVSVRQLLGEHSDLFSQFEQMMRNHRD